MQKLKEACIFKKEWFLSIKKQVISYYKKFKVKNEDDKITSKVEEMIALINQNKVPESNPSCENCAYAKQRAKLD